MFDESGLSVMSCLIKPVCQADGSGAAHPGQAIRRNQAGLKYSYLWALCDLFASVHAQDCGAGCRKQARHSAVCSTALVSALCPRLHEIA